MRLQFVARPRRIGQLCDTPTVATCISFPISSSENNLRRGDATVLTIGGRGDLAVPCMLHRARKDFKTACNNAYFGSRALREPCKTSSSNCESERIPICMHAQALGRYLFVCAPQCNRTFLRFVYGTKRRRHVNSADYRDGYLQISTPTKQNA